MRWALVQTANVYPAMPARREDLPSLAPRLPELRRANAAHNITLIGEAKSLGAQAVCLGELFCAPYFPPDPHPMWRTFTDGAADAALLKELRKAAYENAVVVVAPLGAAAAVVDERGVEPEGPGPVFATSAGRLAAVVGHGAREHAAVADLARAGAQLVLVAGVAPAGETPASWEARFPRAAADHKVHIGAANRLGAEKPFGRDYFGASYFCGPTGIRLRNLSGHPNLVVSDLELPD